MSSTGDRFYCVPSIFYGKGLMGKGFYKHFKAQRANSSMCVMETTYRLCDNLFTVILPMYQRLLWKWHWCLNTTRSNFNEGQSKFTYSLFSCGGLFWSLCNAMCKITRLFTDMLASTVKWMQFFWHEVWQCCYVQNILIYFTYMI